MTIDGRTRYDFPDCMHTLAAAMHMHAINPRDVEISLPFDDWWALYSALDSRFRGVLKPFDGRQNLDQFEYMGFRFKPRIAE